MNPSLESHPNHAAFSHLVSRHPRLQLRWNRNRRVLVSIRQQKPKGGARGGLTLSLHQGFLQHPEIIDDLDLLVSRQGRGHFPCLRQAMNSVFAVICQEETRRQTCLGPLASLNLPGHQGQIGLGERLVLVHQQYWPQLPLPQITWGRSPHPKRRLRSIRLGSYRRRPNARITLHPRLALAWVPLVFVDHVIHHELCHHAQACMPLARESSHSPRFRQWERQFDQYQLARDWERDWISRLLAPHEEVLEMSGGD